MDEAGPSVEVAQRLGIPVLRLVVPEGTPAGVFRVQGDPVGPKVASGLAGYDDTALLHTSGTTSRPKLVPLSHASLAALNLTA